MLNKPDKPWNPVKGPNWANLFVDQISNLSPSEKSVVFLSCSTPRLTDFLSGNVFAYRSTTSMLPPPSNPILHNLGKFLLVIEPRSDEVIQRFGYFDFLDPLHRHHQLDHHNQLNREVAPEENRDLARLSAYLHIHLRMLANNNYLH